MLRLSLRFRRAVIVVLTLVTLALLTLALPAQAANIVVTSAADNMIVNGAVTLREAFAAAVNDTSIDGSTAGNGADVIVFHPSLDGLTIHLTGGELFDMTGSAITFDASLLPAGLTIDALGNSRVMGFQGASTVALINITLTGGNVVGPGGGIMVFGGSLSLTNCTVRGNTATDGGGVSVASSGDLNLINSVIRGNVATGSGGGISYAGWVGHLFDATGSRIVGNRSGFYGGGIHIVSGIATLADADIDSNIVESVTTLSGVGAGVYNAATLTLVRTRVRDNQTLPGLSSLGAGFTGGVYNNEGQLTLTDCEVSGNSATDVTSGGGVNNAYSVWNPGTVTILRTTISGNQSGGGAGVTNSAIMTITDSWILNNHIPAGLAGSGGGISNTLGGATLTVTNTVIDGNSGGSGGGVSVASSTTCDLIDCTIQNNAVENDGGGVQSLGVTTIQRGIIQNNTAVDAGGGVYMSAFDLTMSDVTVSGNIAARGGGLAKLTIGSGNTLFERCTFSGNIASVDGGGLLTWGSLVLNQVTISGNTATEYGGGIHHGTGMPANDGLLTLRQCTISGNTANLEGGGALILGMTSWGGTIVSGNTALGIGNADIDRTEPGAAGSPAPLSVGYNLFGDTNVLTWSAADQTGVLSPGLGPLQNNGGLTETMAVLLGSPAIDQSDVSISTAFATDQRGAGFLRNRDGNWDLLAQPDVGAFEYEPVCTLVVNSAVDGTTVGTLRFALACAVPGDTITFDPALAGQTINLINGQLDLSRDVTIDALGVGITLNAQSLSRVINVSAGTVVELVGLTITGGLEIDGGGIFNWGDLTLNQCLVAGNTCTDTGGGIANFAGGAVTLNNSSVTGNTASGSGGGLYSNGPASTVLLLDSSVRNNSSTIGGGGLYNTLGSTVTALRSQFSGNDAPSGGGLYNIGTNSSVSLNQSTISGNAATSGSGGGINNNAIFAGTMVTFAGNSATNRGGAIYSGGTSGNLFQSTLSRNTANEGGAIYHAAGTLWLTSNILSGNMAVANFQDIGRAALVSIVSGGYNLVGEALGPFDFAQTGDIYGVTDPRLGPLQNNGGHTETMALLFGSSAVDNGDPLICGSVLYDQRGVGFARGQDGDGDGVSACDIGSFESGRLTFGVPLTQDNVSVPMAFNSYLGQGLSPDPSPGQLDSDVVIISGVSDETSPMDFGHTGVSGDYARGPSLGGVTTGGLYAFDVGGGNPALGIQPSTADFTPGHIYLAYHNETGGPITSLRLEHTIHVLNQGGRSSRLTVFVAQAALPITTTAALVFTAIVGDTVATPAAADPTPVWNSTSFGTTLTGLAVPDSGYIYFRFSTTNLAGSGTWDALALDDIIVTPNPTAVSDVPDTPALALGQSHLLGNVYPNPFNPRASFSLVVRDEQKVKVELFDTAGRRLQILHDGIIRAGQEKVFDLDGSNLASGVYLIRATGARFSETKRAVLIK